MVSEERYEMFRRKRDQIQAELKRLKSTIVPGDTATTRLLKEIGTTPVQSRTSLADLLERPNVSYQSLAVLDKDRVSCLKTWFRSGNRAEMPGYIRKQMRQIERTQRLENMKIPRDTDYSLVTAFLGSQRS